MKGANFSASLLVTDSQWLFQGFYRSIRERAAMLPGKLRGADRGQQAEA
jgi:hypothetical protein